MRAQRKALLLSIAALVCFGIPAQAQADTSGNQKVPESVNARSAEEPNDFRALPEADKAKGTCGDVRENMGALAAAGEKTAMCIEWGAKPELVKKQNLQRVTPDSTAATVWCANKKSDTVYATRTSLCSVRAVTVMVLEIPTGRPVGHAVGAVEQDIETSNSSVEFTEYLNFRLDFASPELVDLTAEINAVCSIDSSCKQSAGPWDDVPTPVGVGASLDGTWSRSWTGTKGQKKFLIEYALRFKSHGREGTARWGGDGQPGDGLYLVRCDNEVGKYAGCIVPSFVPTFVVPEKYKMARSFIGMAQASMTTHPGWEGHGQPLNREANESEVQKNRSVVCDSTFKPSKSTPPPAQCDEFPFAGTKQSGRQLGVKSGAECQQYSVVQTTDADGKPFLNLTWPGLNQGKMPPANAKCARASMTKVDNEGVGGELGRKTVQFRLLGNDPYWVDAGNK